MGTCPIFEILYQILGICLWSIFFQTLFTIQKWQISAFLNRDWYLPNEIDKSLAFKVRQGCFSFYPFCISSAQKCRVVQLTRRAAIAAGAPQLERFYKVPKNVLLSTFLSRKKNFILLACLLHGNFFRWCHITTKFNKHILHKCLWQSWWWIYFSRSFSSNPTVQFNCNKSCQLKCGEPILFKGCFWQWFNNFGVANYNMYHIHGNYLKKIALQ